MTTANTAIKVARIEAAHGRLAVKADPDYLPADAWDWGSGKPTTADGATCYQSVAVLQRGVALVANAVADLPFEIRRGETVVDSSADYRNAVKFLAQPARLLWLLQAASYVYGYGYLWREGGRRLRDLRYLLPTSVTPDLDSAVGLAGFKRSVGSVQILATTDDIVYFWRPDPYIELGPPTTSPVQGALAAAGVLLNVDAFATAFFQRGAIKATLLTVEGQMPIQAERDRLKAWWERVVSGIRNAFATEVVNAAVKPVVVGDGIAELANVDLTGDKRKDVATALGIPMSILYSDSATGLGGGGVAVQDDVNFYAKTVIPEASLIADCLNAQVFEPLGLKWVFLPETLDVFQADEAERAQALGQLVTALQDPVSEIAMGILGYELTPEQTAALQAYWADKRTRADQMAQQLQQAQAQQPQPQNGEPQEPNMTREPEEPEEADAPTKAQHADLERWERKALKRLRATGKAGCDFDSTHLDGETVDFVRRELDNAADAQAVKALFDVARDDAYTPAPSQPEARGHTPEPVALACPLCRQVGVDRYADHGGLCVCKACGATFDPEVMPA